MKELCKEHGLCAAAFYYWKEKYVRMDASQFNKLKEMEAELFCYGQTFLPAGRCTPNWPQNYKKGPLESLQKLTPLEFLRRYRKA